MESIEYIILYSAARPDASALKSEREMHFALWAKTYKQHLVSFGLISCQDQNFGGCENSRKLSLIWLFGVGCCEPEWGGVRVCRVLKVTCTTSDKMYCNASLAASSTPRLPHYTTTHYQIPGKANMLKASILSWEASAYHDMLVKML